MSEKKRNWAFVLYPESAPSDWQEKLQQTGLQCCISPLHDIDLNPTGEPKKAHYHVIVCYSGPTSYNVVQSLTAALNAANPIKLEQVKGYYRYLTHKDNPEKAQYSDSDIVCLNGFNIRDFVELTGSEVLSAKRAIHTLIRQLCITEYADLMDYLMDNCLETYYEVASNNTMYFSRYLSSVRNKAYSRGGTGGEAPSISGKQT